MNRNKPFAVDIFQPCIIFGFPDNIKAGNPLDIQNIVRRVQVLLVKNEKEHAWAINSRNID